MALYSDDPGETAQGMSSKSIIHLYTNHRYQSGYHSLTLTNTASFSFKCKLLESSKTSNLYMAQRLTPSTSIRKL